MIKLLIFNKWLFKALLVIFLTIPNSLNAQRNSVTIPGADWEVYLSDSLLFTGNLNSKYSLRPKATINTLRGKNVKILFKGHRPDLSFTEFRVNDSILFRAIGYGDVIYIENGYYSNEFKILEGKTIDIFYRDDKFQKILTLLGTITFKKEQQE